MAKVLAAERFLALKERSGLTLRGLAQLMGYKTASGLQRFLDPREFTEEYLPLRVVKRMDPGLIGKGPLDNPITRQDIYDLAGVMSPDAPARPTSPQRSHAKAVAWELSQIVTDLVGSPGANRTDPAQLAAEFMERAEKALAKRGI